ncbi:hypothetical protein B5C34_11905 [Pacificimonas flava]|uniref:Aminoglycoside phosphotransferase domain-containing protein n=2 Tax=Pacificimonas TaxID=1960290 RepID=A0A219B7G5_9SPHN|nr:MULTISPECIES: phosphotransferase family protein [Pacificimonas]MBZ6378632.1 phosphotransferase family protein [Pacificimonas aurantium]OWV34093.1 hypothetical protein B5C34_11905 [Pacificimonas flava]
MSIQTDEQVQGRLAARLSQSAGADVTIEGVKALSGGANSMSYLIDAEKDGQSWQLVLQQSQAQMPGRMSRAVQAEVQTRAEKGGVPVPHIVYVLTAEDDLGEGFVMEFVAGETLAPRYLRKEEFSAARKAMVGQTAEALARIHSLPVEDFRKLGLTSMSARESLLRLRDSYDAMGGGVPVFELAFARLEKRLPDDGPEVLVHGDYRSGNFIVGEEGLRSVLDWEGASLGHPLNDIGWLCTNTWRFGNWQKPVGGFGEREEFYRAYEAAGGPAVDRDLALVFEMYGSLRWGIVCWQMAEQHLAGEAVSVERAAIGRRVSENEADLIYMLQKGAL